MPSYDVLVVGGGNAGCAAALASARHGARTLLVERYGFLGGTATASMVGPWMTFHSGSERIVNGIAEEMVERLMAAGGSPGHLHDASDYVPTITPFDPEIHKALLFEMMQEAGVDLLLHAYVLDAIANDGAVEGARFATVGGIREYRAAVTIDSTADAYVAASAGVETQQGDARGRVQPASLMFRLSHVDLSQTASYARAHPDQVRTSLKTHERTPQALTAVAGLYDLWKQAEAAGDVSVPRELVSFFASPYPDEVTVNMTRVTNIDPLDPDDLTRAEVEARGQTMQLLRFFRTYVPGFQNARIAATVSCGALRFGQCPVAFMTTSSLRGNIRWTYSPTSGGAITSSEHCRIRVRVVRPCKSARLSDRKVALANRLAMSGSVRQKLLVSSSASSGRSGLAIMSGAMACDQPM